MIMNFYNNNPYGMPNYSIGNSTSNIQQQINQLQALQQQMNSFQQPQQNNIQQQNNNAQTMRGTLIGVNSYQDVVNYPTDASGMPTLFLNQTQGVFWVKKFIDGTNKIQAYKYVPINDYSTEMNTNSSQQEKSQKQAPNEPTSDEMINLQERMCSIEERFDKLLQMLTNNKSQNNTNNGNKNNKPLNNSNQSEMNKNGK